MQNHLISILTFTESLKKSLEYATTGFMEISNMLKKTFLLGFLFISFLGFTQETKFKTYSHTEIFEMIAAEKDTVF